MAVPVFHVYAAVIMMLLILAGDVETNPGPTGKSISNGMHVEAYFAV